ncbi:hypothetical protein LBMAG42_28980 [Deltaproteobacteria bacterium]|nr:hypothetical protein LBMAG42_28980 [Deltaproteobacteria bacterium]
MQHPASARSRIHPRRRRQGSILIVVAVSLAVLLAVASVAVDGQWFHMAQDELHDASEAAAQAAAVGMDGTSAGLVTAKTRAHAIVEVNEAGGSPLDYEALGGDAAVQLGRIVDGEFVEDVSDPKKAVAVQVTLQDPSFASVTAGSLFGIGESAVAARARALGGGPAGAACPLPIAIPACGLPSVDGSLCNVDVLMSADGNDNGAWANIGMTRPNRPSIVSAMNPSTCGAASDTGDVVSLNNGAIASATSYLAGVIDASTDTWDTATLGTQPAKLPGSAVTKYGHVVKSQLIIFNTTYTGSCSGIKMTGTGYEIAGYATAVVYDAVATGPAASRKIAMRIVCETTSGAAGGGYFGTRVPPQFF